MAAKPIVTTCSGCNEDVVVVRDEGIVSARVPANGVRGKGHVKAHTVQVEIEADDGDLVTWDCPRCGYADSYDLNDNPTGA